MSPKKVVFQPMSIIIRGYVTTSGVYTLSIRNISHVDMVSADQPQLT